MSVSTLHCWAFAGLRPLLRNDTDADNHAWRSDAAAVLQVITLDMGLLVAGTKYRGEFEERLKKLMEEIKQNDDIILVSASNPHLLTVMSPHSPAPVCCIQLAGHHHHRHCSPLSGTAHSKAHFSWNHHDCVNLSLGKGL